MATTAQKNLVFFSGVTLVVGTLTVLSMQGTPRPRVPLDDIHPRPLALDRCRECHAPGQDAPLPEQHPPKDQCLECHRPKGG